MLNVEEVVAIIGAVGGAMGVAMGGTAHRKARHNKSYYDKIQRDTRERLLITEQKLKDLEKSFGEDIKEVKDDLRYIRDKIDKLGERK